MPIIKEKPAKQYVSSAERTKRRLEKRRQKLIEEGTYFDLEHLQLQNFTKEEKDFFVIICKKYLETGDRSVKIDIDIDEYELADWLSYLLSKHTYTYIKEKGGGSVTYLDQIEGRPVEGKYQISARINALLKYEWLKDLVERYEAGNTVNSICHYRVVQKRLAGLARDSGLGVE